nr:sulfurtransferase TusA family protein [Micromonospora sp. DSM 115978]
MTNADAAGAGRVVDARDKRCPIPVIELARHIGDVPVGGVVELWANDPAAGPDVRAWCRMRDQVFIDETSLTDQTGTSYRVRRQV